LLAQAREEVAMRRTDAFGLLGLLLLVTGVCLYLTGSWERTSLVYWLVGPVLWFAGFTMLIGWLALRWRSSQHETGPGRFIQPK
jgi:membrane protein CcdC involved in cytochrome C biogenesis